MDCAVSIATLRDVDAIHAFLNDLFSLKLEGLSLRPEGISKEDVLQFLPDGATHKDKLCLIASSREKVVGSLTFSRKVQLDYLHCGEFGMSVHPDCWRKGIGSALLTELETWCRCNDFLKIELGVWSNNLPAIKLYEKFQYQVEGLRKGSIIRDARIFDLLLMGKWLG